MDINIQTMANVTAAGGELPPSPSKSAASAAAETPDPDFAIPGFSRPARRIDIIGVAIRLLGPPRGRPRDRSKNWWICPFHADRTPSLYVNEEEGLFYCRGCDAGGNAITLIK